jgi:hypothetical protein
MLALQFRYQPGDPVENTAETSTADAELVRIPGPFIGRRRRIQQQSQTDHEKSVPLQGVEAIQIALFHQPGKLPEPKTNHKFCSRSFLLLFGIDGNHGLSGSLKCLHPSCGVSVCAPKRK